ncbi:hypothetical protein ACOZ4L_07350 [Haloplanus ruber]|uniref:Uncharacterized protein n=1 Tax=Haloplanus ruber TaxID=869892 RepID=A0ABD6CU71_9EURY|nr:hypothetical protein [Haloplanus ruber]
MHPRESQRSPRAALEALVSPPPPRVRDRSVDTGGNTGPTVAPSTRPDAVDLACWTPLAEGQPRSGWADAEGGRPPTATLLADPAVPGDTGGPVEHTLVLGATTPVRTVRVDYGSLDAAAARTRDLQVRTDDDRTVEATSWQVTTDGALVARFADPPTDCTLFVEYGVTRNPAGGHHTVGVVVNGRRPVEARLVVVG